MTIDLHCELGDVAKPAPERIDDQRRDEGVAAAPGEDEPAQEAFATTAPRWGHGVGERDKALIKIEGTPQAGDEWKEQSESAPKHCTTDLLGEDERCQ